MVEWGDLLDSHLLFGGLVGSGAVSVVSSCHRSTDTAVVDTYQTTPYAPSPTTSLISYCSETLKETFREFGPPAGGMAAVGERSGYWVYRERCEVELELRKGYWECERGRDSASGASRIGCVAG